MLLFATAVAAQDDQVKEPPQDEASKPQTQEARPVVVTATRSPEDPLDVPYATEAVTADSDPDNWP